MTDPKTQKDLDTVRCSNPDCDHASHGPIYLNPGCHPDAPSRCSYDNGVLTIECAVCDSVVGQIAVDPGDAVRH